MRSEKEEEYKKQELDVRKKELQIWQQRSKNKPTKTSRQCSLP